MSWNNTIFLIMTRWLCVFFHNIIWNGRLLISCKGHNSCLLFFLSFFLTHAVTILGDQQVNHIFVSPWNRSYSQRGSLCLCGFAVFCSQCRSNWYYHDFVVFRLFACVLSSFLSQLNKTSVRRYLLLLLHEEADMSLIRVWIQRLVCHMFRLAELPDWKQMESGCSDS